jgi:hypothetical protein
MKQRIRPDFAEPVAASDLREGGVYFSVTYADEEMLVPIVQTMVYVGAGLDDDGENSLYFQDVESFRCGVKFDASSSEVSAEFFVCEPTELNAIFSLAKAIDELHRCSQRHEERKGK